MNRPGVRARLSAVILAAWAVVALSAGHVLAGTCPDVKDAKAFFDRVRAKVHKSISEDQLESYKCLFNYWHELGLDDKRWLSYAMATAYHEARMSPLREGAGSHAKAVASAKWAYDKGLTKTPYHLPDSTTGKIYYGRGLVQLTWATNYKKMGEALGMGDALYREPDLVLHPDIATKVMMQGMIQGKFCYENNKSIIKKCTGSSRSSLPSKLDIYFNSKCAEWYRARRMINGDLAKTANHIAGYAKNYLGGLGTMPIPVSAGSGDVVETEEPPADEEVLPPADEDTGGIDPKTSDDVATTDPAEDTTPLTDDNQGVGTEPDGSGAADAGDQPSTPEEKPVATDEEPVTPKLPPQDETASTPVDAGGGPTDGGGSADAGGKPDGSTEVAQLDQGGQPATGDTPADSGGATTDTPPADTTPQPGDGAAGAADAAALKTLEAAVEAQRSEVGTVKESLAGQQKAIDQLQAATDGNKAAIGDVAKSVEANRSKLDEISQRLQQIGDVLAGLATQVTALKEQASAGTQGGAPAGGTTGPDIGAPGKPAGSTEETKPATPAGEEGWFDYIKGYLWKSK